VVVQDSSDDEEENGGGSKSKIKWKTLEHHGVIFFPPYKAHGVALLHQGKPVPLTQEQEEVCNWWAQVEGSEFAEKELVRKNFEATLLGMLDGKKNGIKSLKDLDFSLIKAHLDEQREARKNRPIDERKRELEEKNQTEGFYKYCLFDGEIEKVSNCLVEPPGIFRGRGEHPHAGRIKQRVVPEFVSLNVGADDPIPICPIPGHSWKRVQSNPEATWLCHFKDERSK
jgi:DNA topoisomerase-1